MSYEALMVLLGPLIPEGESVLWMRRMVLGPTPEVCLQSVVPLMIPPPLFPVELPLEPVWPP